MSRVDSDGVISVRQASGGERLHPCSKTKRSAPCGSVVQVYVNPYDHNEAIAWFCREHVNLDFFDENAVLEDPPVADVPSKPARKTREVETREAKAPKTPASFKSYEPTPLLNWYQRVDLGLFSCSHCQCVTATDGALRKCPACGFDVERLEGAPVALDLKQSMKEGNLLVETRTYRLSDDTSPKIDVLILRGYHRLTAVQPEESNE